MARVLLKLQGQGLHNVTVIATSRAFLIPVDLSTVVCRSGMKSACIELNV